MIKNPRTVDGEEIRAASLSIDLNIKPLSTASMTLREGQTIAPRTYVELFTDNGSVGFFRTKAPGDGVGQSSNVQLDHAVAEVADSIVNADIDMESTVGEAVNGFWAYYKGSKWQLGSVASSNTACTMSASYDTVLDAILSVLEQVPSLMLTFNFSTTPWTVNVAARETTVSAEGRISRNVKSARVTPDDSELYTRVYMEHLPGTTETAFGHIDADTISTYGIIETELSGAENATQAERIATTYLDKHKHPIYSVEISGMDLSRITGDSFDHFAIGKKCRLAIPKYNITVEETITEIHYQDVFNSPGSVSVVLSEAPDRVINYIRKNAKSGKGASRAIEKTTKEYSTRFDQTDQYIELWAGHTSENGDILQQAGLYLDSNGVLQYAEDNEKNVASKLHVLSDQIESSVSAAKSTLYSYVKQTATNIETNIADVENGLRNYTDASASGTHRLIINTTNRTWVQEADPTTPAGGSHTPKDGDIWIESTHQGTWDGAEGFDWEHDEQFDWLQIQGAKIWTWANNKWELVSDQQQTVTYADVIETADHYVRTYVKGIVNDEGMIEVYLSKLEQTAEEIRSEVSSGDSTIYSYIHQTATNIDIAVSNRPAVAVSKNIPTMINGRPVKNGDVWIESRSDFKHSWDDLLDDDWGNDEDLNWGEMANAIIHVRKDDKWVTAIDNTVIAEDADLNVTASAFDMRVKRVEMENGELRANYAGLVVDAAQIRSYVQERVQGLGSEITQTARQIRAEVHAGQSNLYSYVDMTATYIHQEVGNVESDIRASILVEADQIRSDVSTANSAIYSYIKQTATSIESRVANEVEGLESNIEQTASSIRSEVRNSVSQLQSSITVQSNRISLVVEGTGNNAKIKPAAIVSSINNGASSIIISADHVNLDGYVKATDITANLIVTKLADASIVNVQRINANVATVLNGSGTAVGLQTTYNSSNLTLSGNTYTLRLTKINGSYDEWTFSRATSLSGAWGSGADAGKYIVTASPQGETHKFDPPMRLNGNTSASNFSAEITYTSGSTTTAKKSIYGYLIKGGSNSGSYVDVNTKSDGSGTNVARLSVGSLYTDGYNSARVTGSWSSNVFTYSRTSAGSDTSKSFSVGSRFNAVSGSYYIEAYRTVDGNSYAIQNTSRTYKLGKANASTVEIQDSSGNRMSSTPILALTPHYDCVAGLTRAMVNGGLIHDKLYYKDGNQYKEVTNSIRYWYYKTGNSSLATYYTIPD